MKYKQLMSVGAVPGRAFLARVSEVYSIDLKSAVRDRICAIKNVLTPVSPKDATVEKLQSIMQ